MMAPTRTPGRRRLLLLSLIAVIPLGLASVAVGVNVGITAMAVKTFEGGDMNASAAWARASVSLNPFDPYTPHFNLGTAYAGGGLNSEALPELQLALRNAPSPEAACPPRANLALTLERLGDRAVFDEKFPEAIQFYEQALMLWQRGTDDVCYDIPEFRSRGESSVPRVTKKLRQVQQMLEQQQNPGGGGQDPTPQNPTPQNPNGQDPNGGQDPNSGEGPDVESPTLGGKLDDIRRLNELSDRERQNSGHESGTSNTPW
ncbi:MAG TPA: tetratricopeptide repeat protein [Pseudolysinimonas sp.]|nr:tetratricopeptide repeat protein [Pseudolysinimonas sp.]